MNEWMSRPADIQLLIDSGLLFEMNRQILHLFGLAIVARKNPDGETQLQVKDYRQNPELAVFSKEIRDGSRLKYKKFMKAFGNSQIDKRVSKLRMATQWVPPEIGA